MLDYKNELDLIFQNSGNITRDWILAKWTRWKL